MTTPATSLADTLRITTPGETGITIVRDFLAPAALVYECHVRCDLLKRWQSAPGRAMTLCEIDLRIGGAFHYTWQGEGDGTSDVGTHGTFDDIVPNEKLVTSEAWDDWNPGPVLSTTTFEDRNGTTTVTTIITLPSREVRETVMGGMTTGMSEAYVALDALIATGIS